MGQIWNLTQIEYNILEISNLTQLYKVKYKYSVASKSVRILSGVEMSCRVWPWVQVWAGVVGIVALRIATIEHFVYFSGHQTSPHISYVHSTTYTHKLQNKII